MPARIDDPFGRASQRLARTKHREVHSSYLENVPNSQRTQSAGPMWCNRALLGFRVSELSFFRKVSVYL